METAETSSKHLLKELVNRNSGDLLKQFKPKWSINLGRVDCTKILIVFSKDLLRLPCVQVQLADIFALTHLHRFN